MIAPAFVERAAPAYFGFATNVICAADASSMPATPLILMSDAFSTRPPRRCAKSCNFMRQILISPERGEPGAAGVGCHLARGNLLSPDPRRVDYLWSAKVEIPG